MKSKRLLDSFVQYCESNPSERFWQALRNWSGYTFIYGQKRSKKGELWVNTAFDSKGHQVVVEDTFYIED